MPTNPGLTSVSESDVVYLLNRNNGAFIEPKPFGQNATGGTNSDGKYEKGLVVGEKTADSKLYPYDNTASDGTETAVGILDETAEVTDAAGATQNVTTENAIIDESECTGLDSSGKTDLEARGFKWR